MADKIQVLALNSKKLLQEAKKISGNTALIPEIIKLLEKGDADKASVAVRRRHAGNQNQNLSGTRSAKPKGSVSASDSTNRAGALELLAESSDNSTTKIEKAIADAAKAIINSLPEDHDPDAYPRQHDKETTRVIREASANTQKTEIKQTAQLKESIEKASERIAASKAERMQAQQRVKIVAEASNRAIPELTTRDSATANKPASKQGNLQSKNKQVEQNPKPLPVRQRNEKGHFVSSKSEQANRERREEKRQRGLIAGITEAVKDGLDVSQAIALRSVQDDQSAKAATAIGGAYGAAAVELFQSVRGVADNPILDKLKERKERTQARHNGADAVSAKRSSNNVFSGLVGKARLYKRREIQADMSTLKSEEHLANIVNKLKEANTLNQENQKEILGGLKAMQPNESLIMSILSALLARMGLGRMIGGIGGSRGGKTGSRGRARKVPRSNNGTVLSGSSSAAAKDVKTSRVTGKRGLLGRALSGGKGLLKKVPLLGALTTGLFAWDAVRSDDSLTQAQKMAKAGSTTVGSLGGMAAGASAGAAIGSIVPGIGTAIGGVIGGILGSIGGEKIGGYIGDAISDGIAGGIPGIMAGISYKANELNTWIENLTGINVAEAISNAVSESTQFFGEMKNAAEKGLEDINSWIKDITGVDIAKTINTGKKVITSTVTAASDTVEEYIGFNPIKSGKAAVSAAKSGVDWLGNKIGGLFGSEQKHSDSELPVGEMSGNSVSALIHKGESKRRGYNDYNRGSSRNSPSNRKNIDFSSMTVGEIMEKQALGKNDSERLFAVGKYQVIPSTMKRAVNALNLDPNEKFTPELQEKIFSEYLASKKRPQIERYIKGEGGSLESANHSLAQEWASVESSRLGRGVYDGVGTNHASVSAKDMNAALSDAKEKYGALIKQGYSEQDAYAIALGARAESESENSLSSEVLPVLVAKNERTNTINSVAKPASVQEKGNGLWSKTKNVAASVGSWIGLGSEKQNTQVVESLAPKSLTTTGSISATQQQALTVAKSSAPVPLEPLPFANTPMPQPVISAQNHPATYHPGIKGGQPTAAASINNTTNNTYGSSVDPGLREAVKAIKALAQSQTMRNDANTPGFEKLAMGTGANDFATHIPREVDDEYWLMVTYGLI